MKLVMQPTFETLDFYGVKHGVIDGEYAHGKITSFLGSYQ